MGSPLALRRSTCWRTAALYDRRQREEPMTRRDRYLLLEREIEAINRSPDENPNPVMRVAGDGRLIYANPASAPILTTLGLEKGQALPDDLSGQVRARAAEDPPGRLEVDC